MEWTADHDVILLLEMIANDLFSVVQEKKCRQGRKMGSHHRKVKSSSDIKILSLRDLRQKEIDLRREEQERNQQVMVAVLQQQKQTTQTIYSVGHQKIVNK